MCAEKTQGELAAETAPFCRLQYGFAAHLRDPDAVAAPADIEPRRMQIYRDLIYNNIESFVSGGFPVLRSLYDDKRWHAMVRDFVHRHQSASPYFLEISQEFLQYLQSERGANPESAGDPAFLLELAHYEWVELALDVSDAEFPRDLVTEVYAGEVLDRVPVASPLAWSLSYRYPVQRLGPACQPADPPQLPTFLVVYRNRADKVAFLEANAATARLLQLIEESAGSGLTGRQLLNQLAGEIQHPDPDQFAQFGAELLLKLLRLEILAGVQPG
ncbi:DNA-binding domain-containing protein [Microbulbifer sp. SA54]|uniref:HvfC family RiPP maturation protein n=1 Tax=Microbulbifer sp. SA54 TaxID=3401577 RepID=UPI003AB0A9AB